MQSIGFVLYAIYCSLYKAIKLKNVKYPKPQILNAVSGDFNQLLEKVPLENIFAIALTTPEDFGSIQLCIGTIKDLNDMAKNGEFDDMACFAGLAWNPDEWHISSDDVNNSKLYDISCLIGDNLDCLDKAFLLKTYIDALKNINAKIVFLNLSVPLKKQTLKIIHRNF